MSVYFTFFTTNQPPVVMLNVHFSLVVWMTTRTGVFIYPLVLN